MTDTNSKAQVTDARELIAKALYEHWSNYPACTASKPWEVRCEELPGSAAFFRDLADKALAAQEKPEPGVAVKAAKPFMYGIMEPDGTAYMDEVCVDLSADTLKEMIEEDEMTGYTVVPLYLHPTPSPDLPEGEGETGWIKVPEDPPLELLKSINSDNQVLAYENGRYYNAWFEFEQSEGGWFWTDDADSEPNPSHYRALHPEPSTSPSPIDKGEVK